MSAGFQPNKPFLDQLAGQLASSINADATNIIKYNNYITAIGGATALEAIGYSAADAATLISTMGNLAAYASGFTGTAVPTLDYQANAVTVMGPQ